MTPYYGSHLDFNDDLQIVEVPHAWVKLKGKNKDRFMSVTELLPGHWITDYHCKDSGKTLRHKSYH
jgi:nitrogen fixation protein FixH